MFIDSGKDVRDYYSDNPEMARICLQCGLPYGQHTGDECPVIIERKEQS